MPIYHVSKVSPSHYHLALATWVVALREVANMPCSSCVTLQTLYLFSAHFIKCAKYMCKRVHYDENFSIMDFDHLIIKRQRLEQERQTILD
jgi:hypothetical protein